MVDDLLIEIRTEELPPKSLLKLITAFKKNVADLLNKLQFTYTNIDTYATPRRLALIIKQLNSHQPDQTIERKGPQLKAAYKEDGTPTPACAGFARSCGVTVDQLITIKNKQGEWVGYIQHVKGKSIQEIIPEVLTQALAALPVAKWMRWGDSETEFVRPVHGIILLYGDQIIPANIFGCATNRVTQGHRFLAPTDITIPHADAYASLLATEGYVIANFDERRQKILQQAKACVEAVDKQAQALINQNLLDEVTGLVEWPVALCGSFDASFLKLPQEVLISSMENHQRYFPVCDAKQNLLPYFLTMSNLQSADPKRVTHGNERVLRARLSDASFFYQTDSQIRLADRLERLKGIVFQAKLGTLFDKSQRIALLAQHITNNIGADNEQAERAGLLAKTDLTTSMVNEFPELQGIMGYYYALHDGEKPAVALAIKEHYQPRYAGDVLAETAIGQAVAIADRLDTLVGTFGIGQLPTGDKDPFGLRRAALGIIRTIIERNLDLDLHALITLAAEHYSVSLPNKEVITQVTTFLHDRLRVWYQDQGVPADVFSAVAALTIPNLLDIDKRVKAVAAFKLLTDAESLSIANKRVSNILAKYEEKLTHATIDPNAFEHDAEMTLAKEIDLKAKAVHHLFADRKYDEALHQLVTLRKPVDDFFDHVLVMTDNKAQRENRILLLTKLRALFLQVADIALLQ